MTDDRKRPEPCWYPAVIVVSSMVAGAALFAAGAAFMWFTG